MNDIALLQLEENRKMQSRIDDDSDPHVAKPVKLASKGRTLSVFGYAREGITLTLAFRLISCVSGTQSLSNGNEKL